MWWPLFIGATILSAALLTPIPLALAAVVYIVTRPFVRKQVAIIEAADQSIAPRSLGGWALFLLAIGAAGLFVLMCIAIATEGW